MTAPATYFKLGLFALAAIVGLVVALFGLGVRGVRQETVDYHTYFDESVQGLELGAPVKYRGVKIGRVSRIKIAPDRKHVDVELEIEARDAHHLGLQHTPPEVRAQLGTQGLTGVKYVDIDFFAGEPPMALPFAVPENYIPSRPSLFKGLESAGNQLPELIDRAAATIASLGALVDDVRGAQIGTRVERLAEQAEVMLSDVRRVLGKVDRAGLPARTASTLQAIDRAATQLDTLLQRMDGERGLVASAQRATETIGALGRSSRESTQALEQTLRELADAARAFRELVDTVERDPDILVKGRARSGRP